MPASYEVAVLVGSLRKKSLNRMLAHKLSALAPPALSLRIVDIGDLPFYNDDLEREAPHAWRATARAAECVGAPLPLSKFRPHAAPLGLAALDAPARPVMPESHHA